MSDRPRRLTRVKHPILHLEVLGPDGERSSEHRVFCQLQQRSVAVGTCCACVHCDTIEAGPVPSVNCSVALEEEVLDPDPEGRRTAVGGVLREGSVVLDPRTSIGEVLEVLRSQNRRSIAIVDHQHEVVGIVHEAMFLRGAADLSTAAGKIMAAVLAIRETVPVRRALELLASAHLREATVINNAGVPIGVFRDVDGLRWLARARDRSR